MRTCLAGWSFLVTASSGCISVGTGDGGGPALRRWVQVEVIGEVAVDTGNPDVVAPRYRYRSLESFDVTGVMAVAGMAYSAGQASPGSTTTSTQHPASTSRDSASAWPGEREAAIEHARADVLRRAGTCAQLLNASASVTGSAFFERRATITTASDVELDDVQIEGLCRGGALP